MVEVIVHPDAKEDAFSSPACDTELNVLIARLEKVSHLSELVRQREFEPIGPSIWKWKRRRNPIRPVCWFGRSPKSGNPFVLVCRVMEYSEYDRTWRSGTFTHGWLDQFRENEVVRDFIALLDQSPEKTRPLPLNFVGLRSPLTGPIIPMQVPYIEESREWVQRALPRLLDSEGNQRDKVIDAVLTIPDGAIDRVGTHTKLESVEGRILVTFLSETNPVTQRRYSIPKGPLQSEWMREVQEAADAHVDPFLVLHQSQTEFFRDLSKNPRTALPLSLDGPGGSGKTSLLMHLVKGVLSRQAEYGNTDSLVRIVTASTQLSDDLVQALALHLRLVEHDSWEVARSVASEVCTTIDNYLLGFLPVERVVRFQTPYDKIDWPRFRRWFEEHKRYWHNGITPHQAWCVLRVLLLGDRLGRPDSSESETGEELRAWFESLNENRRQGIDDHCFSQALTVLAYYQKWKTEEQLWDEGDLVDEFLDVLEAGESAKKSIDLIIVDESQDLTPDVLRCVLRSSSCFQYDVDRESGTMPLPFVFAADDLQTINPSGFRWGGFDAVFWEEVSRLLNRGEGFVPRRVSLSYNFRMSEGVHKVAHSLRKWMKPHDESAVPLSMRGNGFSLPVGEFGRKTEVLQTLMREASCIIVPDVDLLADDVREILADEIDPSKLSGKVRSVSTTKGREFKLVLLVGFESFVKSSLTPFEIKFAQQMTYVAASRARDAVVWYDPDFGAEEWFWRSPESLSPAGYLDASQNLEEEHLDVWSRSEEDLLAQAGESLGLALSSSDSDNETRCSDARIAQVDFLAAGRTRLAGFAGQFAEYFSGRKDAVDLGSVPSQWFDAALSCVSRDRAWECFPAEPERASRPELLYGRLLYEADNRNFARMAELVKIESSRQEKTAYPVEIKEGLSTLWELIQTELTRSIVADESAHPLQLSPEEFAVVESWGGHPAGKLSSLARLIGADAYGMFKELPWFAHDDPRRRYLERKIVVGVSGAHWINDDDIPALVNFPDHSSDNEIWAYLTNLADTVVSLPAVLKDFESLDSIQLGQLTDLQQARFIASILRSIGANVIANERP